MDVLSPQLVELLSRNFCLNRSIVVVSFEGRSYQLKHEKRKVQVEGGSATTSEAKKKVRLIFSAVTLLVLLGMMAYTYSQVGDLPKEAIIGMTIVVILIAFVVYGLVFWIYNLFNQGAKKQIEQDFKGVDAAHFIELVQQKYQVESWKECQVEFEGKTFLISPSKGKLNIVQKTPSYLFIISMIISGLIVAFLKPELINNGRFLGSAALLPALVLNSLLSALYRSLGKGIKAKFISKVKVQIQGSNTDLG